jgi:predicted house-cleaning noncanonical NTP pyrophosphatase (MazG superfamily)
MDIFSIDVTHNELNFIRQSLETVTIQGKDAKFLATLQVKIEHELSEIQRMKQEEEQKKMLTLSEVISKPSSKK